MQPVPYFRNVGGKDICANRTGILIVYRSRGDQLVIVYNDGSLYYRGVRFKSFHHQKLTSEEVDQLLTAFAKADFEALPGGMPSLDKPADPAITLLCSRFQEVPVDGNEDALRSLIPRLERLKAKATSETLYLLTYKDKRKIRLMRWPYQQLPLARLEEYKHLATLQKQLGKAPGHDGDYSSIYHKVRQEFLDQLPGALALNNSVDPNRDTYFSDGGKLFRVEYNSTCTKENPYCGRFDSLRVGEVISPEAVLSSTKEDFENPAGVMFYRGFIGAWLWPTNIALPLAGLHQEGRVISTAEFESRRLFYFELLFSGGANCDGGVDFIEGDYKYEKVSVCQIDVAD